MKSPLSLYEKEIGQSEPETEKDVIERFKYLSSYQLGGDKPNDETETEQKEEIGGKEIEATNTIEDEKD